MMKGKLKFWIGLGGLFIVLAMNAQPGNEINLSDIPACLEKSRNYLKIYQPGKAKDILEKLYQLDSMNIQVSNLLGELYYGMNNKTLTNYYFNHTLTIDSLNLFALITLGDFNFKIRNYGLGEQFYKYALKNVDSTNYYIYKQLGNLYFMMGEDYYLLASDYYYKAILYNPYDMNSYLRVGNIEITEGNYFKADSIATQGLKYDSNNSNLINVKALALYNLKFYSEVMNTLEHNFVRQDSLPFSMKYAGLASFNLNDYDKARYFLEKLIKTDSSDYDPYIVLGQICLQQKDFDKGADYLKRAERLHFPPANKTSQMYKILADIYNQEKDYNQATQYFLKAYELIPEDITLVCKLAYQYDYLNQKEKAISYYKMVVNTDQPDLYVNEIKLAKSRLDILKSSSRN